MKITQTLLRLLHIGEHFTWQPQLEKFVEETGECLAERGRLANHVTIKNRLAFIDEFVDQTIVGIELILLMDRYFTHPKNDGSHFRYALRKFRKKIERTEDRIKSGYYEDIK